MQTQLYVDRGEALADGRGQRALERDAVPLDRIQRFLGDRGAVLFECRQPGIEQFVLKAAIQRILNTQGGIHELGADTIPFQARNRLTHPLLLHCKNSIKPSGASAWIPSPQLVGNTTRIRRSAPATKMARYPVFRCFFFYRSSKTGTQARRNMLVVVLPTSR